MKPSFKNVFDRLQDYLQFSWPMSFICINYALKSVTKADVTALIFLFILLNNMNQCECWNCTLFVTLSVKTQLKPFLLIYCFLYKIILHKVKDILWKCNIDIFYYWLSKIMSKIEIIVKLMVEIKLLCLLCHNRFWNFSLDFTEKVTFVSANNEFIKSKY